MILKLSIKDRQIAVSQDNQLYSGSRYIDKVLFEFDNEWSGYVKTARFFIVKDEKYDVLIEHDNDEINIPNEVLKERGYITLGVIGTKTNPVTGKVERLTTQAFTYKLAAGIAEFGDFDVPEEDLWGQYVDAMDDYLKHAEAIQNDITNRHQDIENRHDDIESRHEDIKSKYEDIKNAHDDVQSRQQEIEEIQQDIEQRQQDIVDRHEDITEQHKEVEQLHDEVEDRYQDIVERHEDIESRHEDIETRHDDITQLHQDVIDRFNQMESDTDYVGDAWEDIENRHDEIIELHEEIHKDADLIHEDVGRYEEINADTKFVLYDIRNTIQEWEDIAEDTAFNAKQAFESEINARQSEINALDSELCAKEQHLRAHHDAKKAGYHEKEAKQAAEVAQFYAGFVMPEFYFDFETMSLAVKYPEQGCQLEFMMIDNELYWNWLTLEVDEP